MFVSVWPLGVKPEPLLFAVTSPGPSATIAGVKRSSDVLAMDTYDTEYEVDDDGVVVVRKSGFAQKKRMLEGKRFGSLISIEKVGGKVISIDIFSL